MTHLFDKTKEFLLTCSEEEGLERKIEYIEKTLWVGYPAIKRIEDRMFEILRHPRIGRMPSLLILARTNNGKSTLLKRFAKKNLAFTDTQTGSVNAPVLGIVMPEGPTEILFLDALLRATNLGYKRTEPFRDKLDQVFRTFEKLETKIILIDEIHHIAAGSPANQRLLMNLMKNISTLFSISFIAAGTAEARNIFSADEQLSNRFQQMIIPVWENNEEFKGLLKSFEMLLPFEEPSNLVSLSEYILNKTDRTIGDIYKLLQLGAIHALKNGSKCIEKSHLSKCGHLSPTELANERRKPI
ncbi:MAG TPA: TniB family NTP-binding protein [Cyclobacteriaceae bacterium]|nr:TniB family NTP-binding protein [Cyclobacteriaceae bacterium]HRJ83948.1 TniB family NTP-binding protein [Cyclobacteriaceae bacterium]